MSYTTIPSNLIGRGKGVFHRIFELAKSNFEDHDSRINQLESSSAAAVGVIIPYGNSSTPAGWKLCDGTVLPQALYLALFNIIGSAYNVGGEGAGNFRLPNLLGRCTIGKGQGTYSGATSRTIGTLLGEENHALSSSEIPSHSHAVTDAGHTHSGVKRKSTGSGANITHTDDIGVSITPTRTTNSSTTGITLANSGSGTAHNNMQPYQVAAFIIKY